MSLEAEFNAELTARADTDDLADQVNALLEITAKVVRSYVMRRRADGSPTGEIDLKKVMNLAIQLNSLIKTD